MVKSCPPSCFLCIIIFFFSKILDKEIVVKSLSRVLFQLKDKGNFREFLVGKVSWLIEFPCITRFRVMNMFCGRTSAEKQIFVREILGGMEIGHGSDLSVTAGSVPADLHLSSKGLFFMFELNCPKQRALSTLAEVMIAILKRELADVSTNFQPRWLLPRLFCFYSTLFLSFFSFFLSPLSFSRSPISIIIATRRNIRNYRLTKRPFTKLTTGAGIRY